MRHPLLVGVDTHPRDNHHKPRQDRAGGAPRHDVAGALSPLAEDACSQG